MNVSICPTITASDAATYQQQIERVATFATRLHIDLSDGTLAPSTLVPVDQVWWPGGVRADIHVMYKRPLEHLPALIALQPQLIVLHAEGEGSFVDFAEAAHHHGIETGVALLQTTPVETIKAGLEFIDHVVVFSGDLGKHGGKANPALLSKVKALKALKPQLEIAWDGGVNAQNASALARAGVEVLNVGGFIHGADDPEAAYRSIEAALGQGAAPAAHSAPQPQSSTAVVQDAAEEPQSPAPRPAARPRASTAAPVRRQVRIN